LKQAAGCAGAGAVAAPGFTLPARAVDQPIAADRLVPQTLDLAAQGGLALNALLGSLDPAVDFECIFLSLFDVHPAYMLHWSSMVSGGMPKYVEALPFLRLMSRSRAGADLQQAFMDAMLRNMADDGLVYDRVRPDRPWNTGVGYGAKGWDEDYANLAGNGRLLAGLCHWLQWTGEPRWKDLARKTAERMRELAVVQGDIAYYPNPGLGNDFSYPRKTGWSDRRPPERANEGFEGATLFYLLQPLRGFARYFALTGDERFLELSRKFVNLGLQAKFWGSDHDMHPAPGAERGHFRGHFHGNLAALRGLLDHAIVANDFRLKQFARDGYEWARQHGIHRLGIFPGGGGMTEGCTIADMTGLAVALTDAGLGDYWDDVEQYARNGLVSSQLTDREELVRVSEAGKARPKDSPWGGRFDWRFSGNNKGVLKGQEITERVIDRSLGSFADLQCARYLIPMTMTCCSANGSQALYYAWEAIVRRNGDTAEINLWLNRRTPWCDVWSWLPHSGRLMVKNRGMRRLAVRKPGWARPARLRCSIDDHEVQPSWIGNRMLFDGLRGDEALVVECPLTTTLAEYSLVELNERQKAPERYACEFRGHTAIRVRPVSSTPGQESNWYRLFRREALGVEQAPMGHAPMYIHPVNLVRWEVT